MSYESAWEILSGAVERIMASRRVPREQAQTELCHAISDGRINLRVQLDKHAVRPQTSRMIVSAQQLEIPINLDPGVFDWQESRPIAPWRLRRVERHQSGPWYLKRIELSRGDITAVLLENCAAAPASVGSEPMKSPRKRERKKSKQPIAETAIREIWPEAPPPREKVSNADLVDRVSKHMKRTGASIVSQETILRAAGRK